MQFYVMMDIIILVFGAYIMGQYLLMKKDGELKENMLLPKEVNVKRCKDVPGFIKYMGPKQLAFGATVLICGVIGIVQDSTGWDNMLVYMISIVICLASIIWYSVSMKKAIKAFWN